MIMQVHDELVFEVPTDTSQSVASEIQTIMSQAAKLCVPLIVDVGIGDNWEQAH